jgi:hypothetical protein
MTMRVAIGKKIGPLYVGISERLPKLERHHRYFMAGFALGVLALPVGVVAWAMLHTPVVALIQSFGK